MLTRLLREKKQAATKCRNRAHVEHHACAPRLDTWLTDRGRGPGEGVYLRVPLARCARDERSPAWSPAVDTRLLSLLRTLRCASCGWSGELFGSLPHERAAPCSPCLLCCRGDKRNLSQPQKPVRGISPLQPRAIGVCLRPQEQSEERGTACKGRHVCMCETHSSVCGLRRQTCVRGEIPDHQLPSGCSSAMPLFRHPFILSFSYHRLSEFLSSVKLLKTRPTCLRVSTSCALIYSSHRSAELSTSMSISSITSAAILPKTNAQMHHHLPAVSNIDTIRIFGIAGNDLSG